MLQLPVVAAAAVAVVVAEENAVLREQSMSRGYSGTDKGEACILL